MYDPKKIAQQDAQNAVRTAKSALHTLQSDVEAALAQIAEWESTGTHGWPRHGIGGDYGFIGYAANAERTLSTAIATIRTASLFQPQNPTA